MFLDAVLVNQRVGTEGSEVECRHTTLWIFSGMCSGSFDYYSISFSHIMTSSTCVDNLRRCRIGKVGSLDNKFDRVTEETGA